MTDCIRVPGASFEFVLRLGDDNLVIAQRLAEWSSKAHDLEDDIALTNIGLDHLGQARALLTYAGEIEGAGRSEDDLAFHRSEREFVNCLLVEQPNGDFAHTIVRQLLWSSFQLGLWESLTGSVDQTLGGIAAKALKEARYHYEYAGTWMLRLGDGTDESHRRTQAGLEAMWPYTDELFDYDDLVQQMHYLGVASPPSTWRDAWTERVERIIGQTTVSMPTDPYQKSGGRSGMHTTDFGYLLAEMQHLPRSMPEAAW